MTFGAFFSRQSLRQSLRQLPSLSPPRWQTESRDVSEQVLFSGGAQGHGAAVTDDESRERVTGSCSLSPLSPQARLALTLRAMFSEGSCQSAVAEADGQMARDMKETGKVAATPLPSSLSPTPTPSLGGPWPGRRGRGSVVAWQLAGCQRRTPRRRRPPLTRAARTRSGRFQPVLVG